jgi:hypothetical protein
MYQLKANAPGFHAVDGPHAGREYKHGISYAENQIPEQQRGWFTRVSPAQKKADEKKETSGGKK